MQQEYKKSHRWKRHLLLGYFPKVILGLGALADYFS